MVLLSDDLAVVGVGIEICGAELFDERVLSLNFFDHSLLSLFSLPLEYSHLFLYYCNVYC